MKKPTRRRQTATPQPGARDGFALPVEALLREAPEVAPSAEVWERIEAALRDDPRAEGADES